MYIAIQSFKKWKKKKKKVTGSGGKVPRELSKLQYTHLGCFSPPHHEWNGDTNKGNVYITWYMWKEQSLPERGSPAICMYMLFLRCV